MCWWVNINVNEYNGNYNSISVHNLAHPSQSRYVYENSINQSDKTNITGGKHIADMLLHLALCYVSKCSSKYQFKLNAFKKRTQEQSSYT